MGSVVFVTVLVTEVKDRRSINRQLEGSNDSETIGG